MRFWQGQFVTLHSSDPAVKGRSYSIANVPNQEGDLIFIITKVEHGGTSQWVHDTLQEGDFVKVNGPNVTFIGDPSAETPVLCLAAGSGLAPILSLASGALFRGGFKHPAEILFSAKTEDDLFEKDYLKYLEQKFRNFKFKYSLTRESNPKGFEGRLPELCQSYIRISQIRVSISRDQQSSLMHGYQR